MNRLFPTLLLLLLPGLALQGEEVIDEVIAGIRGDEPIAVLETITVTASQDGVQASATPVGVHVERTPDGLGRIDLNGYTVFIDGQALSVVHDSNDGAWVRLEHSGRPVEAMRRLFADVPSIWVSLAFGVSEDGNPLKSFLPAAPDLVAVPMSADDPSAGFRLVGTAAKGSLNTDLPGSMSVAIDGGRWVPEGGRLEWTSTSARALVASKRQLTRPHRHGLSVHGFNGPGALERHDPLGFRIFMPVVDASCRQHQGDEGGCFRAMAG